MKRMRKCNDEIYQLAKDQALDKKLKKKKKIRALRDKKNKYSNSHVVRKIFFERNKKLL
jgi:hypothetical protein